MTFESAVLGLDPASSTGCCRGGRLALWPLAEQHRGTHPGLRHRALAELLAESLSPEIKLVCYEKAAAGANNFGTAVFHAQLEGVILATCAVRRIATLAVAPTTLKKFATGSGRADKQQMIAAAKLHGATTGGSSDLADAYFAYLFGVQHLKRGGQ